MTIRLRTTIRFALILACLLAAGPVLAAWKPVPPEGDARRVRLVAEEGVHAGETVAGIWTVLEPGSDFVVEVEGGGRVRIETRPVFADQDAGPAFRFAVDLGDTVRRFKRKSQWEGTFTLRDAAGGSDARIHESLGLGDLDRMDLEWNSGPGVLRLTNREEDRAILARVLLGFGLDRPGSNDDKTKAHRWILEGDAPQIGWDSNPYLTAKQDPGKESKWFLPVDLGVKWRRDSGSRLEPRVSYSFQGDFYDDSILNEYRHRLRLKALVHAGSSKPRAGIDLVAAYRFTHKNDTYNGRGDREEYETIDPGTGQSVNLSNRFDYVEHRFLTGLARHLGRSVEIHLNGFYTRRDYIEDYGAYEDIYALDQDRVGFETGLDWRLAPAWILSGEARLRTWDYDEKFSRDASGAEVRSESTSLRKTDLVATIDFGRGPGLRLDAEMKYFVSRDRNAGYWDYDGIAFQVEAGWRWAEGHRIDASLRRSHKTYDLAHVDHDPANPLREKTTVTVRMGGDMVLNSVWRANLALHWKDADNNNAGFAYERFRVQAGASFRF